MQNTKTKLIRKYLCLPLLWFFSANAAAASIFDGYIPCAKEDECGNQRGGFYEDQPGALDGSRVTSYGSADTQAERNLSHILVNTRSAGNYDSSLGGSNAAGGRGLDERDAAARKTNGSVQCSASGQPLLVKICSVKGQQSTR